MDLAEKESYTQQLVENALNTELQPPFWEILLPPRPVNYYFGLFGPAGQTWMSLYQDRIDSFFVEMIDSVDGTMRASFILLEKVSSGAVTIERSAYLIKLVAQASALIPRILDAAAVSLDQWPETAASNAPLAMRRQQVEELQRAARELRGRLFLCRHPDQPVPPIVNGVYAELADEIINSKSYKIPFEPITHSIVSPDAEDGKRRKKPSKACPSWCCSCL